MFPIFVSLKWCSLERFLNSVNFCSFMANDSNLGLVATDSDLIRCVSRAYRDVTGEYLPKGIDFVVFDESVYDFLFSRDAVTDAYWQPNLPRVALRDGPLPKLFVGSMHELGHSRSRREVDDPLYETEANLFELVAALSMGEFDSEFATACLSHTNLSELLSSTDLTQLKARYENVHNPGS
jgi:hypothetical protein